MGIDPRKRQKQLARKKAKRKSLVAAKGSDHLKAKSLPIGMAQNSPVHECLIGKNMFESGIGTAIISRKMPNHDIAAGIFLLDVYCLGVKNCFLTVMSDYDYATKKEEIEQHEELETIHPTCIRKLVEQSAAYAKNLGFPPHKDYSLTRKIFGDIEADACPRKFEFGKDGKPFYISGPRDSSMLIKKIIRKLTKKCGEGNFHFLTPVDPDTPFDPDDY